MALTRVQREHGEYCITGLAGDFGQLVRAAAVDRQESRESTQPESECVRGEPTPPADPPTPKPIFIYLGVIFVSTLYIMIL